MGQTDSQNGQTPLVIFSNLDGVMLDRTTLSPDGARQALALLAANRIPLVLFSSRTRAEIELLQEKLGIHHPFISENGAAVYIPAGYFREAPPNASVRSGYHVIELGIPYRDVVSTLHRLARQLRVGIESFSQMSVEEVARACGASLLDARLAKLRDHAEPFRFTDATPKARARLLHALQAAGFLSVFDGRFYHALARVDLAARVRLLRSCYGEGRQVVTVGLADRMEDLGVLQEVDLPIIVQGPAGRSSLELYQALPQAVLTRGAGPAGWSEAIVALVQRFGTSQKTAA
jgi:mannosyl-3-phosphoglycerate phosphatase